MILTAKNDSFETKPLTKEETSADAKKCSSVWHSYGIITEVLLWFAKTEKASFQLLNQYFYNVAVSRVQTRFSLKSNRIYLTWPFGPKWGNKIFCVHPVSKRADLICNDLFDFSKKAIIQVGKDMFSFLEDYTKKEWEQYINVESPDASHVTRATPLYPRRDPTLCNWQDKIVLVSGGVTIEETKEVQCYSIQTDSWREIAKMNQSRHWHSCCALGDFVYIFGGIHEGTASRNFEVLDAKALLSDLVQPSWKLIQVKDNLCYQRYNCILAPYSETELLISGGRGNIPVLNSCIYDIESQKIKPLRDEENGDVFFACRKNQSQVILAGESNVRASIALVQDSRSYDLKMVSVGKGAHRVSFTQEFGECSFANYDKRKPQWTQSGPKS